MQKLVAVAINIGAIVTCLATTLAFQLPRVNQKIVGETPEVSLKIVEQEKTRLKLLSQIPPQGFGFNNLIAGTTFLSYAQYFGDDRAREANKTGYSLSPSYLKVVIDRDPRFMLSYLFISTGSSIFAGQPCKSIALYAKGLQSLSPEQIPEAYTVWRYQGMDQLLFLGDGEAASRSYQNAAEWADRATFGSDALPETEFIALSSRQAAVLLKQNPRSRQARIAAWGSVLAAAIDKKTVEIAVTELAVLGMDVKTDRNGRLYMQPLSGSKAASALNVEVTKKVCSIE